MTRITSLADHLSIDLIEVQSNISSRKKLLEKMAQLLSQPVLNNDVAYSALSEERQQEYESREKEIYHLLLEREKLGNTGIGNGVALPHSRCEYTNQAIVAIVVLNEPIDFDSIDGQGVNVAFGLLVPQEASQEHLNLLASIARLMSNTQHKELLSQAHSAQQVINYIHEWSKDTD